MKKPPNPQMAELGPFYQVCWLGLFSCVLCLLALFCFCVRLGFGLRQPLASVVPGGAVVMFLGLWRVIHGRQKRGLEKHAARGVTPVRPRLQHTLDALGDKLREFSGDASARLILIPDPAVVLSTLRSKPEPVVEMTAGFLSTYASHPRLMEAALAHEAGHIAARDVERFLRMLSLMRTLAWCAVLYLVLCCGVFVVGSNGPRPDLFPFAIAPLLLALVLALAWSALLVAREVQADAFAVKVLGERHPMQALLERQLALRVAQTGRRNVLQRLRTWLIQPDLRWRSTLPFLRGHLGARVEVKLGLATAAFISILVRLVAQLWLEALAWSATASTEVEARLMAIEARVMAIETSGLDAEVLTPVVIVCLGMLLGAVTWVAWIAYHFYWVRSRTLGRGDSGTRSSGLRSLLYFCLPGGALFLVAWLSTYEAVTWEDLQVVAFLPTLAVLLWAAGKVALMSARERRRDRPSLSRAILSFLGILMLALWLCTLALVALMVVSLEPSPDQGGLLLLPSLVMASLGAGMLAHYLAAPSRQAMDKHST